MSGNIPLSLHIPWRVILKRFINIFEKWLSFDATQGINPRTYTQSHTPTVVQGELMEFPPPPLPWVFDMLQYYETILPSVESLWSSPQDEVYFMGGGAAGGLWRHLTWSPPWILWRIRNQVKTVRIKNFLLLSCKTCPEISHVKFRATYIQTVSQWF